MSVASSRANNFIGGEKLPFKEADSIWRQLLKEDDLSLARKVLHRIRQGKVQDGLPTAIADRNELCRQEAMLTSKDLELSAAVRHDMALEILRSGGINLQDPALDGDVETLGIAGGIHKRRWQDLGQYDDLLHAAEFYSRGAKGPVGDDGYAHINAAFLEDLLVRQGDNPAQRRQIADNLRSNVLAQLPPPASDKWWREASRAEAFLGLGKFKEAKKTIEGMSRPEPWKLQVTARQMATLAHLRWPRPFENPEIKEVFDALLPGADAAVRSCFIGKVGLALSGGGFRASFYHLGVLACLAELDILRHIEVLSCVSGGSIVGACYWLMLRRRLLQSPPMQHQDYLTLVRELIQHFGTAVEQNVRRQIQPSKAAIGFSMLFRSQLGAMNPEKMAEALDKHFYGPIYGEETSGETLFMDQMTFIPKDHIPKLAGSAEFNTTRHNWLRSNKVPALVINATTVNTGRGWQFTPTWMGESPWSLNEGADNIARLQWAWYQKDRGWRMRLARAVAASASVPGIFAPLKLGKFYDGVDVQLIDGGVYDNQGATALLAMNCNVLLVSDAAGQLLLEQHSSPGLKGLGSYAMRSIDLFMERIRQITYSDLRARQMSGLLRGLMFLHMKAGLDTDTIQLPFASESFEVEHSVLSASGIRKDFQKALAELRTDLDAFTADERHALMACGYQMACKGYEQDLEQKIPELAGSHPKQEWPFTAMLKQITSIASDPTNQLRDALQKGSKRAL